ncbi:hypothetical protein PtA15_1A813 [Puccinia triticina]|uniref:Uncharacterized protein n=1 Tax=Puccinia triticina TaxID=208348 RepID=A0ABY7C8G9_9BASI|nr:uncharacterized protein PtA15_1A813 [Puccinia triticina]WAQ81471.1 hypothetical protein PtA15_1A813 [Puccinia triticina]
MLSFSWIVGATLLLSFQQSSSALPAGGNPHQEKPAHLQARYRIVGQPPPPCKNHICPLALRSRSEQPAGYSTGQADTSSETQHEAAPTYQAKPDKPANSKPTFHGTHQTAPITCGDGTKPPCGQSPPQSDTPHFPGTHQTAPITCGDGTKPPCGQAKPAPVFPGTHQTAPVTCGDGTKPPCGQVSPPVIIRETAPIDCGDDTKGPCVITDPGREPPHPDLLPHPYVPLTCADGSKPPCGQIQSSSAHFPGTHQTAPVTCGDGTKPPCHSTNQAY